MAQQQHPENNEPVLNSEDGSDHSAGVKHDEPSTGETTERQPSWRPGGKPAGQGIYNSDPSTPPGTDKEIEGSGI